MESGIQRYRKTVPLFLILGFALIFLTALVLYFRGMVTEAWAQLLFILILFGVIYYGRIGGLVSAIVADIIYAILVFTARSYQSQFITTASISFRLAFYIIMGVAGGWLFEMFKQEIKEIEERVLMDRTTALFTTRYFITSLQKEMDRSRRYKSGFSVVIFRFKEVLKSPSKKLSSTKIMRSLADLFREEARIVDDVALSDYDEISVVLPEINKEGCKGFINRVRGKIESFLHEVGIESLDDLEIVSFTFPDEEKAISNLVEEYGKKIEASYIRRPKEYLKK